MQTGLSYRSISACVRVEGQDLAIHDPTYDERTQTALCWIASEAGKNYSVCFKLDGDVGGDIAGHVLIDGKLSLNGRFRLAHSQRRHEWVEIASKRSNNGDQPILFSRIETRGKTRIDSSRTRHLRLTTVHVVILDDGPVEATGSLSSLGTIRMQVYRTHVTRDSPFNSRSTVPWSQTPFQPGKVHKKSKKAGSHVTRYACMKETVYIHRLAWLYI